MKLIMSILIVSIALCVYSPANAHSLSNSEQKKSSESAKTATSYSLPYPGILPDNPLYFLKKIRDSLIPMLIQNNNKKLEYYLNQANKRFAMVNPLLKNKKNRLALDSAESAEQEIVKIVTILKNNPELSSENIRKNLHDASEKHQEILIESMKFLNKEETNELTFILNQSVENQIKLEKLIE